MNGHRRTALRPDLRSSSKVPRASSVAIPTPDAGESVIRLGEDARFAPGVYLVRLVQGTRTATCRAVVVATGR